MKIDFNSFVGKTLGRKGYVGPRVGLELEYEKTTGPPMLASPRWHTDMDHSLRTGGLEFISSPLEREHMADAIVEMLKLARSVKAKVTPRCGLHVHVNVTHMTWKELYRFITYYVLLEPHLFHSMAPGRELSHFCVPTWTNTALTEHMYKDGQRLKAGIQIPGTTTTNWKQAAHYMNGQLSGGPSKLKMLGTPKYAALNVSSLKKFGTLEFRQAPSSLNALFIARWATILLEIQRASTLYAEPIDIIKDYGLLGVRTLCDRVGFVTSGKVDPMDQEDAVDAATIIAGHVPVNWQQLEWEIA